MREREREWRKGEGENVLMVSYRHCILLPRLGGWCGGVKLVNSAYLLSSAYRIYNQRPDDLIIMLPELAGRPLRYKSI